MSNYNIKKLSVVNPELCQQLRHYCYSIIGACQTVHKELGPFLNEYMYQDALKILLDENHIPYEKEYYFSVDFHGHRLNHRHYVDFRCCENVFIECKATETIVAEHRQQLWNYMRLTKNRIGILYNFAPVNDQCERYFLDTETNLMYAF